MKITIGIPTYNRKELLQIMAKSLYDSHLPGKVHIRVYDDSSSDYDVGFLEKLFPNATSIKRNEKNLRSDKNIYQMYTDFLNTDDDYFFNADSDIILKKNWLNEALDLLKKTDGILSLFNANSHESYTDVDEKLCLKKTVGSAGTLFKRARVEQMIRYFDSEDKVHSFDWQWSKYFNDNDVPIYCVKNSLIQHLVFTGQNSKLYFDVGRNFKVETIEQGQILNDILLLSNDSIRKRERSRQTQFKQAHAKRANNFWYHLKRMCIILLKKIVPQRMVEKLKTR